MAFRLLQTTTTKNGCGLAGQLGLQARLQAGNSAAAVCTPLLNTRFGSSKSTKLWGGRFSKDTDGRVKAWTQSVTCDTNLAVEDMWGSMAHVTMLGRTGIVELKKAKQIVAELGRLQQEFIDGTWALGFQQEDVHMNVEAELINRLGMDVGGRMHTCRSRNDQVVLDSKLYARNRLLELREKVVKAVQAFLDKAEGREEEVMISYTHFQHAQPVSVAFWLSHYAAVLLRDLKRLKSAFDITDESPLGAGAISGTSFPIDRHLSAKLMGFQKVHPHSLDATSARDFMWESVFGAATVSNSLSRLAEEMILFASYEYRTITLDDGFAMGSSMMPQKKNPGVLELIRGRCGRMTGYMTAGLTMTKGLPSAYNRDFHEDKEILIASMDMINLMVDVVPALIESTTLNTERMGELTHGNFGNATELANYLVLKHGVPFRESHHIVGSLVGDLYRSGENFSNFDRCYAHLKNNGIDAPEQEIRDVLDPKTVMMSYNSYGGTGVESTKQLLADMRQNLADRAAELEVDRTRVETAHNNTRDIAKKISDVNSVESLGDLIQSYEWKHQ